MTPKEFNTSVDLYSDGLYRFMLKMVRDTDIAQDLVQDIFEKLWRKINHTEFTNIKSYLFTTGYHLSIDFFRREKSLRNLLDSTRDFWPDSVNPEWSQKADLQKALDLLPEVQKSVILLRDYEGYNYKEIGEITGLGESQVKVYIFRARTTLKKNLTPIPY